MYLTVLSIYKVTVVWISLCDFLNNVLWLLFYKTALTERFSKNQTTVYTISDYGIYILNLLSRQARVCVAENSQVLRKMIIEYPQGNSLAWLPWSRVVLSSSTTLTDFQFRNFRCKLVPPAYYTKSTETATDQKKFLSLFMELSDKFCKSLCLPFFDRKMLKTIGPGISRSRIN